MQNAIRFEDHHGLVHMQAKRGLQWAQGAGVPLEYDDLYQEASIAFLLAAEGYREDSGYKFSAYYTMTAFSQFRRVIGVMSGVKNLNPIQRQEIANRRAENERLSQAGEAPLPDMNYGLRPMMFSELTSADDDGSQEFEATIDGRVQTPEEIYAYKEIAIRVMHDLSPLAALVIDWLYEPPEQLMQAIQQKRAHRKTMQANGKLTNMYDDGFTLSNVLGFLKLVGDVTDGEIRKVSTELRAAFARIEKEYANE